MSNTQGQIGARPASVNLSAGYRNDGPIAAPRPPPQLDQVVTDLNEVYARGRAEINALEKIHDILRAHMSGPVPCDPNKDCEAIRLPLGEIPERLAEQSEQRTKLMDAISGMLGT